MKILITGITGLFGSYLAREFAPMGEIHGFRRKNSSARLLEGSDFPVTWHEGDLSDIASLEEAMRGIDLVIHAAGKVSFDPKHEELLHEVNVKGTTHVVNAMLNSGVPKLVYVSSVSAIGRSAEQSRIDENFKWVKSPLNTDYGVSKYLAELEAWRGEQEGLELLVVNPSILLGKIKDDRSSTDIYQYVLEERKYYPVGDLNYIDVRDAAQQVRALVENNHWGERFILNNARISYQEFFAEMAGVFGKKAPSRPLSGNLLNLVVFGSSILRKVGLSKVQLGKKSALLSQQKVFFDNAKVNRVLNPKYTSLKDTFLAAK
ncbi:NAD-dependent epimerase/dehydratase family protein [Algoriphagus halophytocola]|uniref:NAD-dependent epimerase/dehydratase family protein n=1 Tax=Algoriphagus halophytocola TaxID=2991499 RepID=A0ABY6MHL2_9BACT|nr:MULTISPECIES: NAD-dependent epimerase/dehydratase family protein [unclassified Algoriphagus]UZD21669.1 NAD-dependent epimerase/dehydratase family protein [Algoriphagus sp. TR-M5]WBL42881.1 NAD-dependent epimerase/dehydratase family protein [Algoriphagus sp. TR-M9]